LAAEWQGINLCRLSPPLMDALGVLPGEPVVERQNAVGGLIDDVDEEVRGGLEIGHGGPPHNDLR